MGLGYTAAMHFKIPHNSTQDAALTKVKRALEDAKPHMKEQATLNEERCAGNMLHFDVSLQGKNITGTLEVTESDFVLNAKLPLMWRMFEGMIQKEIQKQVQALGQGKA